jgi:chromate reductase
MKVLILCTSPREGSQTLRFSNYLKSVLTLRPEIAVISILDFEEFDIPAFGKGKIDKSNMTPFQELLISTWENSNIILFASPEYNWTTNGEVFIMLDQLGNKNFEHLFENKLFAFIGVSSGRGGKQAALDVAKVVGKLVSFQNMTSILSPKIFESHETGKNILDNNMTAGNVIFESGVESFVDYTLKIAKRWFG